MTINDGGGLFDKYGMIQSIIDALNRVQVSGYQNMGILIDSAQKLAALKNGLKKEEEEHEKEISELREILDASGKAVDECGQ